MERPEGAASTVPQRDVRQPRARRPRRLWRRVLGAILLAPLVLGAAALVLALVYKAVTPPSTLMLARWLTGQPVVRQVVPLDQISPDLRLAVVASEDAKFCLHGGVDWDALWDVIDDEDSPSRGASTITMQTTKNVFLWGGRSYLRKAIEIPLALVVDAVWGKRRTLEVYLNLAEWGDGIFGAEAAARHWFHRSARDLTRAQATLLAVSLPNPHLRKAGQPTVRVRGLAGRLIGRMNGAAPFAGCIR